MLHLCDSVTFANSVDPDHSFAFDLGQQCLLGPIRPNSEGQYSIVLTRRTWSVSSLSIKGKGM